MPKWDDGECEAPTLSFTLSIALYRVSEEERRAQMRALPALFVAVHTCYISEGDADVIGPFPFLKNL